MLAEAGCSLQEIAVITGRRLSNVPKIFLDKYLSRTSKLAENAIAKFEDVIETEFAKRPAKWLLLVAARPWRARRDSNS